LKKQMYSPYQRSPTLFFVFAGLLTNKSMPTTSNPWLDIPLADYEQHMALPDIGQAQMLAEQLARAVRKNKPKSVAIIGCAGGNGLEELVNSSLQRVVCIDINPSYIDEVRQRFAGHFSTLETHVADIQSAKLEAPPVDLLYAALIFEYVALAETFKVLRSICVPGGRLVAILQVATPCMNAVSPSPYTSLQRLAPIMRLRQPQEIVQAALRAGFALTSAECIELPSGKSFSCQTFLL
jgi:SAM-dependent methyltransferase